MLCMLLAHPLDEHLGDRMLRLEGVVVMRPPDRARCEQGPTDSVAGDDLGESRVRARIWFDASDEASHDARPVRKIQDTDFLGLSAPELANRDGHGAAHACAVTAEFEPAAPERTANVEAGNACDAVPATRNPVPQLEGNVKQVCSCRLRRSIEPHTVHHAQLGGIKMERQQALQVALRQRQPGAESPAGLRRPVLKSQPRGGQHMPSNLVDGVPLPPDTGAQVARIVQPVDSLEIEVKEFGEVLSKVSLRSLPRQSHFAPSEKLGRVHRCSTRGITIPPNRSAQRPFKQGFSDAGENPSRTRLGFLRRE